MDCLALDTGQVDGVVEGADNTMITTRDSECETTISSNTCDIPLSEAVLDVVQGGVDEHAGVVPCAGLDANGFVDECVLGEVLVRDGDGYAYSQVLDENTVTTTYCAC